MTENKDIPEKQEIIRDEKGRFPKGVSGNPKGRPEGISFTGRIREILSEHPERFEELCDEYMKDKRYRDLLWRQIDGNPKQATDITSDGEKLEPLIIIKDGNSTI